MEPPKNYLIDMDGVLITGGMMIPGADGFLARLKAREAKFLILTNNSRYTPGDLSHRLQGIGLDVVADNIYTSAMATARFLQSQRPNGTAFVIGDSGLTWALHSAGYVITAAECHNTFTNTGAGGAVEFTLPAGAAGLRDALAEGIRKFEAQARAQGLPVQGDAVTLFGTRVELRGADVQGGQS